MALQLQFAALLGFAALMLVAAFEDLRRLIIPNALTLSLCLLWPLYVIAAPSLLGTLGALGCALAVFIAGALCFSRGYLGGGDVKLLSASVLLVSPVQVPTLMLSTALAGGLLATAYIALAKLFRYRVVRLPAGPVPRHNLLRRVWRAERRRITRGLSLPYSCAITVGVLLTICD